MQGIAKISEQEAIPNVMRPEQEEGRKERRGNKEKKQKMKQAKRCHASPSGNRTPVSRVTGGDTYHYTNED